MGIPHAALTLANPVRRDLEPIEAKCIAPVSANALPALL